MGGLSKVLKLYGQMSVIDKDGNKATWVWDYANEKPRLKSDMTKDEFAASEKIKWGKVAKV